MYKIQDLYESLKKANDHVQDLKESKEIFQNELEKIEHENRILTEENENLINKINSTQRNLSVLKQSPESKSFQAHLRRSMTLIIPKVTHEQSLKSHESDQENSNDLSDEI
ncbi:hypothetical protein SteCoe_38832 [Stentor coeruleus]|uniref:Uncharacterized protein n=1 Tax=Stentor coeruleus TaxID=5963 RepID=A0A1R2AL10_9CILI|nr:hypothetical protein SteCoe_38832 [Stentor coeruleus]